MKVFYMKLEGYQERYTELLSKWTTDGFENASLEVVPIEGTPLGKSIETGSVLDAHGRSHFALTQVANLVQHLKSASSKDCIYIEDMFLPGYEAIPYILQQMPADFRPFVVARNHAQSIDIDDFTFPMRNWMSHYEKMVAETTDLIVCGSTIHEEAMKVDQWRAKTLVAGLPFDGKTVRELAGNEVKWADKKKKVVYSSRWDEEKQPWLFLALAESLHRHGIECVVCTGGKELRGHFTSVATALRLEKEGKLVIRRNCTKPEYYREMNSARVQFNCARQDFVSYTMLEASALGTASVLPCFRSFPEAYECTDRKKHLYVPFDMSHAEELIIALMNSETEPIGIRLPAKWHDRSIGLIASAIKERSDRAQ